MDLDFFGDPRLLAPPRAVRIPFDDGSFVLRSPEDGAAGPRSRVAAVPASPSTWRAAGQDAGSRTDRYGTGALTLPFSASRRAHWRGGTR